MTKVVSSNRQMRYQSTLLVCLLISNHHKSKMIETSNIDFDLFSFLRPLKHHQFLVFRTVEPKPSNYLSKSIGMNFTP